MLPLISRSFVNSKKVNYVKTQILNFNVKDFIFLFSLENNNSKKAIMQYFSQPEINAQIDLESLYILYKWHVPLGKLSYFLKGYYL